MRRLLALVLVAAACGACSAMTDKPATNVRPPSPGVPATAKDITGIYRTIHQGVLQLRADGELVLVVPEGPGPTSGTFTLSQGHLSVYTRECGQGTGNYDVMVTGEAEAGKAVLNFSAVNDPCENRRHYLSVDPWVYANS